MAGRRFVAVLVLAGAGLHPAMAQEDLNRGKTPVQLFASDCADCHKNARALGGRENARRLAEFLRVHYTASRESATAIAGYLASLGPAPRVVPSRPGAPGAARPAAVQERKPGTTPAGEKPAEKPAENPPEPAAAKPAEPAPAEAAPAAAPASPPPAADPQ